MCSGLPRNLPGPADARSTGPHRHRSSRDRPEPLLREAADPFPLELEAGLGPASGPCARSRSTGRLAARGRSARPRRLHGSLRRTTSMPRSAVEPPWVKNAEALRRILSARLSSRFSRTSSLSRCRSLVVRPGRRPASSSAWRTHLRSVAAEQPILAAIEPIAAYCDS